MKVIGKGTVHLYKPEDEVPHAPEEGEHWQESFVLYFFDPKANVYAFLRMSQEPNREIGYTTHWIHVWTPKYVYRDVKVVPIAQGARTEDTLISEQGRCIFRYDGNFNWRVVDKTEGFELTLSMTDFHIGIGPYSEDEVGSLVSQANKHHIESTGVVTGRVSTPDEQIEVSGIAWRDHSWGLRYWDNIRTHRAFYALFGEEFSFFPIVFIGADGNKVKAGAVIRGDTVQMTTDFDILSYMGSDAVTNAGGVIKLNLDGVVHTFEFIPETTCAVSFHQNFVVADTMCQVRWGDKVGVGVAETSTNPQGGKSPAAVTAPSYYENGLFPRIGDPWAWNTD